MPELQTGNARGHQILWKLRRASEQHSPCFPEAVFREESSDPALRGSGAGGGISVPEAMVTIAVDGVTEYPLAYVALTFTAREDGIYITEIEIPYFQ